jgi:hypothetical protein
MIEKRELPAALPDFRELDAQALEALEAARCLPHGCARSHALKEAGKLRILAEKTRSATKLADV